MLDRKQKNNSIRSQSVRVVSLFRSLPEVCKEELSLSALFESLGNHGNNKQANVNKIKSNAV